MSVPLALSGPQGTVPNPPRAANDAISLVHVEGAITLPTDLRAGCPGEGLARRLLAAGVIHTDFERGFIRAEIYSVPDLEKYGNEKAIKEAGKMRIEGKDYVMQDGDVCHFLFNV